MDGILNTAKFVYKKFSNIIQLKVFINAQT